MRILEYYKSKTVLVCTSDRFFREVILDKFIRLTPDIDTIYLLMEPDGKLKSPDQLFKKMFQSKCFKRARQSNAYFDQYVSNRVKIIMCDFQKEDLGISPEDSELLISKVNLIVSYMDMASTTAKMYQMIDMNIYAPFYLMTLAKKMKHIQNFVHVSSITSLYNAPGGEERIYPYDYETDGHVKRSYTLSKGMKDENGVLPTYPNNYVYAKRSCEILLDKYKANVPLTILRPGFIGACWKDPYPGWVISSKGMAIIFTLVGLGEVELILCDPNKKYMEIPADALCDYIITTGAQFSTNKDTVVMNLPGGIRNTTNRDAYNLVVDYWNKHDLPQRTGPIKLEICPTELVFLTKIEINP